MHGTTTKRILKTAMRGQLPDEILDRRKQGFGVPVARWMKEDLLPLLREELAPEKIRREGFFAADEVTVAVNALSPLLLPRSLNRTAQKSTAVDTAPVVGLVTRRAMALTQVHSPTGILAALATKSATPWKVR
jgi:asparagine synthetase B (glutamine-hydrolysing)